ncbi:hypothetical protein HMPREF9999_00832 [Alloprevotella sp. oral taxon 473 str. F0040]|nr:hypothetical protein HMPREF9999_00832 [Alloprevotella sp. oral taxon 473 str. F0040]
MTPSRARTYSKVDVFAFTTFTDLSVMSCITENNTCFSDNF